MIIFLLNYSEATGQIHILSYIQFLTQEIFFIGRKEGGVGVVFQLDMESSANVSQNVTY